MTESFLREKFSHALSILATDTESLPERVRKAMMILTMFNPEHMPDRYSRDKFAKLSYLSTDRQATGDEGNIAATLETMRSEDIQGLAESIVELHDHLIRRTDERYAADQEPLDVAPADS